MISKCTTSNSSQSSINYTINDMIPFHLVTTSTLSLLNRKWENKSSLCLSLFAIIQFHWLYSTFVSISEQCRKEPTYHQDMSTYRRTAFDMVANRSDDFHGHVKWFFSQSTSEDCNFINSVSCSLKVHIKHATVSIGMLKVLQMQKGYQAIARS